MKKKKKRYISKWKAHTCLSGIKCDLCGNQALYFYKYDAEFCQPCNQWISDICGDPDCTFCSNRPDTPEEALVICNQLFLNELALKKHISKKADISKRYALNKKYKNK